MRRQTGYVATTLLFLTTFARAQDVEIERDEYGVPHVYSNTDEGAFFGAGYACAQDRLFQMEMMRMGAKGRLAELIGELTSNGGLSTVDQDAQMRHIGLYEYASQRVSQLDSKTLAMLQAYTDGVNGYLDEIRNDPELIPAPFTQYYPQAFQPGQPPEDWTVADCVAVWDRFTLFFHSEAWAEANQREKYQGYVDDPLILDPIAEFIGAVVVHNDAAVIDESELAPGIKAAMDQYVIDFPPGPGGDAPSTEAPLSFSHVWAVTGGRTNHGGALLHSDPKTRVNSPNIFWEVHMKGESFDARGIGSPGCPGFLIGFNENVSWGMTALTADLTDLLEVVKDPRGGPNDYLRDGVSYSMEIRNETIFVNPNVNPGQDQPIRVKRTVFGPVVTPLVHGDHGADYVLRSIPQWDAKQHTTQALVRMIMAEDAASFREAAKGWRAPATNCVFADSSGNIGYTPTVAIPTRSSVATLAGAISQPGDLSAYDWQQTVPKDLLPWAIKDDGAFWSGNHLPAGTWYPINLRLAGLGDTFRSWRLYELLEGPGATPVFTQQSMIDEVHFDNVSAGRREMVGLGLKVLQADPGLFSAESQALLAELQSWSANGAVSSIFDAAFYGALQLDMNLRSPNQTSPIKLAVDTFGGGEAGAVKIFKLLQNSGPDPLDENIPLHDAVIQWLDWRFASAWADAGVPEDWLVDLQQGPGVARLKFHNSIEGFGSLDPTHDSTWTVFNPDPHTIEDQRGLSYAQSLDMNDIDTALAVLPSGSSADPSSPYFLNQNHLWVGQFYRAAPLDRTLVQGTLQTTLSHPTPVSHYGQGVPHVEGQYLSIDTEGPFVSGSPNFINLTGAREGITAYLVWGTAKADVAQNGITLLNDATVCLCPVAVTPTGTASFEVPPITAPPGQTWYVQWAVDFGGGTYASTDGLEIVVH